MIKIQFIKSNKFPHVLTLLLVILSILPSLSSAKTTNNSIYKNVLHHQEDEHNNKISMLMNLTYGNNKLITVSTHGVMFSSKNGKNKRVAKTL